MNDQHRVADCPHRELAVGWALHALEPVEESLVAAHMPDCPSCMITVAETEEVCATLGLSVPEVIPSAELEQRVLAVTIDRRAAPVVPLPPPISPAGNSAQPSRPGAWLLSVAAAVVLIAAVGVLGVRVAQLSDERNLAARQVTEVSEALQMAADPTAVRVPLVTQDGGAVGMVLASRDNVSVVATRLPDNRVADQIYVLWGLSDQAPVALSAFDVRSNVPGLHTAPSAVSGTGEFTGYAVSLEPGRSTPAAPTKVLAKGQVRS